MRTADFDFQLPSELIAQFPAPQREQSRLCVLNRSSRTIEHRTFPDLLDYLRPGDLLVLNNSRVIPARLRGTNAHTGGQFELLLLEQNSINDWWTMVRPGKRARIGTQILIHSPTGQPTPISATVLATNPEGHRRLQFKGIKDILDVLESLGEVPLPPYINRLDLASSEIDRQRYQTVFAQSPGSVAAPTAGLHFTESFLGQIRSRGVQIAFVTLHVGLGTFAPVKSETISGHKMHEERFQLTLETADLITAAKRDRRRIIAVGTTSLRVLETVATQSPGPLIPGFGKTRLFIHPPYDFKLVDALLTNFHLPRSTLLVLVSAFAAPNQADGRDFVLSAYADAIRLRYRFFSYGDAMLLL